MTEEIEARPLGVGDEDRAVEVAKKVYGRKIGPEEVREEVIRCIEVLGAGRRYICGPDHHIKPDVSVENTLALFATATDFTRSADQLRPPRG